MLKTFLDQILFKSSFNKFPKVKSPVFKGVVNLELQGGGLVGRLTILIGKGEERMIKEILLKYLLEEEVKPGFLDKAADWVQKKVPLESEKENPVSSEK